LEQASCPHPPVAVNGCPQVASGSGLPSRRHGTLVSIMAGHHSARRRSPLPESLRTRPFLLGEAVEMGMTRNQLRSATLRHPARSVYVAESVPESLEVKVKAWQLVLPDDAALFGVTAAEWYGLPVRADDQVHIIVPAGGVVPVRRLGLVPHEGLGDEDWQLWRDVKTCTPAVTFLQLATTLTRDELVIVGDQMVRHELITPEELRAAVARVRRRRGVVLAREASGLVRPRVDSPPETRVRLVLVDGGLPCPETGVNVFDDAGGWIGRPDLAYLVLRLALQYEGDVHRTNKKQWRTDILRDEVMQDHGWDVVRLTADDLRRKAALCDRVWHRMQRQAARLGVPLPPRTTSRH
jgi:hypothetical protein